MRAPSSTGRLCRTAGAAALSAATLLGLAQPAAADHGGSPTARDGAARQAAVSQREAEGGPAAAALPPAQGTADRLRTTAEMAVEAFNAARLQRRAALRDAHVARLVLVDATSRVDAAQSRVAQFASAAYMSGGLSSIDAMLSSDGPAAMLSRVNTLQVISDSQRDALQTLDAARVYQLVVQKQAQAALHRENAATDAAAAARSAAQSAVHEQTAVLADLQQRQAQLHVLLRHARRHVSALERARLAAIARAKAAAAARA